MQKDSLIYVAGHTGMVGSACLRLLRAQGYDNLLVKRSRELDLRCQADVVTFFAQEKPEYVILAAAQVGGIGANDSRRGEFIYDNLMIQTNVIHAAYLSGVKKLLFLGSTCIYPRDAPQPIPEEALLSGPLEPTNEPYAIAKIAGIKLCQAYRAQYGCNFISAMPTNLYGKNDNYDPEKSHVLAALLQRFTYAKRHRTQSVTCWGTGAPLREFLHVDDLAGACLFLMQHYNAPEPINIGSGQEISIKDLALLISKLVGYQGDVFWDSSKPDGTPRKLCDTTRLSNLGWRANIGLENGLRSTLELVM